ncbi:MAG: glycosyltransferase [Candidatus Altiarchaeales archaeon]|nr:glycosyltransferase [Candidatus Altiarchaeales archaeon]MBD3417131.1 glycosyltransferase [Candidatus Altiarchaeales archaeon]
MKVRIGVFSWETLNSIKVGGVAAVVTQLSEALADLGHEVHVFTRTTEGKPEHELINGVWEHRCLSPGMDDFIEYMDHVCDSMVSAYHWAKAEYGEFDVLHGHDWHSVNALANIRQNTGFDNIVWTCHSTEYGRNGNNFADNWFSARIRHREWLGGYISKKTTTVSYFMRSEISREYQIPEEKTQVIYNGIDTRGFKGEVDPGRVKERYGLHPLDPVILFFGRIAYQKGPDLLLEAIPGVLDEFYNARFIFAGSGDMINHLHGRAHWLGVHDKIRVLGYVSEEEKKELFKSCDMVCVPSRNEPFGIITLEAWASGKPVVATDVGGPSEIIDNFRTGVKTYLNPDSIAWGIKYLLGDRSGDSLKKMSEVCLGEAQKYDWHEIAKQYLEVYGI